MGSETIDQLWEQAQNGAEDVDDVRRRYLHLLDINGLRYRHGTFRIGHPADYTHALGGRPRREATRA